MWLCGKKHLGRKQNYKHIIHKNNGVEWTGKETRMTDTRVKVFVRSRPDVFGMGKAIPLQALRGT
jgi:hypothetical protein